MFMHISSAKETTASFDSDQRLDILHPLVISWIFTSSLAQLPTKVLWALKAVNLHPLLKLVEDQANLAKSVPVKS